MNYFTTWKTNKKTPWREFKEYFTKCEEKLWQERCIWAIVGITLFVLLSQLHYLKVWF